MRSSTVYEVKKDSESFKGYKEEDFDDSSPAIRRHSILEARNLTPPKSTKSIAKVYVSPLKI